MNKYILTLLTVSLFFNCEEKMTVSFDDTKSMTILAAYDSYMSNDTESIEKLYSEDAHVFVNSVDSITIKENMKNLAMHHELFDDIKLTWGDGENTRTAFVQTSTYPENDVTLAWFTWNGTGKASGEAYKVPTHVVYVWGDDGKIDRAYLMNDSASFNKEMSFVSQTSQE